MFGLDRVYVHSDRASVCSDKNMIGLLGLDKVSAYFNKNLIALDRASIYSGLILDILSLIGPRLRPNQLKDRLACPILP